MAWKGGVHAFHRVAEWQIKDDCQAHRTIFHSLFPAKRDDPRAENVCPLGEGEGRGGTDSRPISPGLQNRSRHGDAPLTSRGIASWWLPVIREKGLLPDDGQRCAGGLPHGPPAGDSHGDASPPLPHHPLSQDLYVRARQCAPCGLGHDETLCTAAHVEMFV